MSKGSVSVAVLALAVLIFMLSSGFAACSKPQPQQGGDTSSLVMSACAACHSAQKVCEALGTKDREAWNATVARMVSKGAKVPAESISPMVDYLTALQPGSQPVCK